jgi:uncharacterized OB-fold protein
LTQAEVQTEKKPRPIVPYLVLPEKEGEKPYLAGSRCKSCGTAYVGRRWSCGKCFAVNNMDEIRLSDHGELYAFSIVYQTAPGIQVPFVAGVVDLPEGTAVRCNIEGIEPDPNKLVPLLGKRVEMYTEKVRTDREGNDVIAFKFRPAKG